MATYRYCFTCDIVVSCEGSHCRACGSALPPIPLRLRPADKSPHNPTDIGSDVPGGGAA